MIRTLIAAAAAAGAVAQDWGTQGSWQTIQAQGTSIGPYLSLRKPTGSAGCMYSTSNETTGLGVWQFDAVSNAWNMLSQNYASPVVDPLLIEAGGQLLMIDELNGNSIQIFNTATLAPTSPWRATTITGWPQTPRVGQRYVAWGAKLYAMGGWEPSTSITHNDMWALDLGSLITTGSATWIQVAGDLTPGIPEARAGFSWHAFGIGAIMYGGILLLPNAPAGTSIMSCFSPQTNQYCYYHSHVYGFYPGNSPAGIQPNGITGTSWYQFPMNGAYNGPVPDGRFEHTAGQMGDQLYVFGGITAKGLSNEMWAYNLMSQTWAPVQQMQPWPNAQTTNVGFGSGIVLGRHIFQIVQQFNPNSLNVIPNTAVVWKWTPSASSGAGAAPALPLPAGATAGIVIGCLIGFFNLVVVFVLAYNQGALALPSCISFGLPSFGGSSKAAPAGFYSSVSDNTGYAPPA